jgi:hypothetical protein
LTSGKTEELGDAMVVEPVGIPIGEAISNPVDI